ncbi:hypothetical protein IFVP177_C120097 [Vibrio parahaemolyticus]
MIYTLINLYSPPLTPIMNLGFPFLFGELNVKLYPVLCSIGYAQMHTL